MRLRSRLLAQAALLLGLLCLAPHAVTVAGCAQMYEAHGWVFGLEKLWQLHHREGATGSSNPQASAPPATQA